MDIYKRVVFARVLRRRRISFFLGFIFLNLVNAAPFKKITLIPSFRDVNNNVKQNIKFRISPPANFGQVFSLLSFSPDFSVTTQTFGHAASKPLGFQMR